MSHGYCCAKMHRVGLTLLASSLCAQMAFGTPVLEEYAPAVDAYLTSSTTNIQVVRPEVAHRGVSMDGSLRAPIALPLAIAGNPGEAGWSSNQRVGMVRLDTGHPMVTHSDLFFNATVPWQVGRCYNPQQVYSSQDYINNGLQGHGWFQMSQPEIVLYEGATDDLDVLYLVYGADRFIEFKRHDAESTEFKAKNGAAGVFHYGEGSGSEPDTYTYTDPYGMQAVFFGFDVDADPAEGQIWKIVDPAGNTAYVGNASTASTAISSGFNGSGYITTAYDSSGRRFRYIYSTLDSVSRLTSVVAEVDDGGWTEVGRVTYGYYGSLQPAGTTYGSTGDLAMVTITTPLTDASVSSEWRQYMRYWSGSFDAGTNPGHDHGLKYIVDYEGTRAYDWLDSGQTANSFYAATDTNLAPYAAAYFEYDSSRRVNRFWSNGACGCGGSCNGTHDLEYETNQHFSNTSGYDSAWYARTVVWLPDGSYLTQYFDETGQPLDRVLSDIDPDTTVTTPDFWVTHAVRNGNGVLTALHTPANVTTYYHADDWPNEAGDVVLSETAGLIREFDLVDSGDLVGFKTADQYRTGTTGTLYYSRELYYDTANYTIGAVTLTRAIVDASTDRDDQSSSAQAEVDADYTITASQYPTGTELLVDKSIVSTLPKVSPDSNGPPTETAAWTTAVYRRDDGSTAFTKDTEGRYSYTRIEDGLLTKRIVDAQTNHATAYAGDVDPNGTFDIAESSDGAHVVTTYAYDDQGRSTMVTHPDGRVTLTYYTLLEDGRLVTVQYPKYDSGNGRYYGPASLTVTNHAGQVEASAVLSFTGGYTTTALTGHIDEDQSDLLLAISTGSLSRLTVNVYNEAGVKLQQSRTYFDIPASLPGTEGTNYDETTYAYDDSGHRYRVKSPTGTITRTVYDEIGRPYQTWVGTNDSSFDDGEASGTDNMVKVSEIEYDSGAAGGNSYVTKRTSYVENSVTDKRETSYTHDSLGRVVIVENEEAPHSLTKYDNLGRVVATGLYSSTASLTASSDPTSVPTNRLALTESAYDDLGRVWKTTRHKITAATGASADTLTSEKWFDAAGRVIKEDGEQLAKYAYDRLGRRTHSFILANCSDDSDWDDALDVSGDIVLQESQTVYESTNSSNVLMTVGIERLYTDYGLGEHPGALDSNGDADDLTITAANISGRVQINAMWYDALDRVTTSAHYGTNSTSGNVATFARSGLSAPSRGNAPLVTTVVYNDDGTRLSTTDPMGIESRTSYDDAGRVIKVVRNYDNDSPGGVEGDEDQTIKYEYTDGLKTKVIADLPDGETDQETIYTYGVESGGDPDDSEFCSGNLLRQVQYPDSSGGTDVVLFAYNAQGQQIYTKDQAGNVIEHDYDDLGRLTHKRATTVISGFDDSVRRISTTYDNLGRRSRTTQYDNPTVGSGSVLDDVEQEYDGWGLTEQINCDYDSLVSTGGTLLNSVTFTYEKATTGRNTLRRTGMTLPDGDSITYQYLSLSVHDNEVSRVTKVKNGVTELAHYKYNGVGHLVQTSLTEADVYHRLHNGAGTFTALDQHNRLIEDDWMKNASTDFAFVDSTLTYDDNSNITVIEDHVHTGWDMAYTMDDLNRVIDAERGTWSGSAITTRTEREEWGLTQTGNWDIHKLDLTGDGDQLDAGELNDDATFTAANELTARDIDDDGTEDYTFQPDAVGNMVDDGQYLFTYDVFGRLVEIQDQSSNTVAEYRYNGLGHRIMSLIDTDSSGVVDGDDTKRYLVYDDKWRVVAEFADTESDPTIQYTHHAAGLSGRGGSTSLDNMICCDVDKNGGFSSPDGTLETREYYCHNYRGDVCARVTSSGTMLEWVKYSAYGVPFTIPAGDTDGDGDADQTDLGVILSGIGGVHAVVKDLDLDYDVDASDLSAFSITTLGRGVLSGDDEYQHNGYTGHRHDEANPILVHARNRVLHTELGRWLRRDPLGYVDGMSLYEYVRGWVVRARDPGGDRMQQVQQVQQVQQPAPPPPIPTDCDECCEVAERMGLDYTDWGGVICCGMLMCGCEWVHLDDLPPLPPGGYTPGGRNFALAIIENCVRRHELDHFDANSCTNRPCTGSNVCRPTINPGTDLNKEECAAHQVSYACLIAGRAACNQLSGDDVATCLLYVNAIAAEHLKKIKKYCGIPVGYADAYSSFE